MTPRGAQMAPPLSASSLTEDGSFLLEHCLPRLLERCPLGGPLTFWGLLASDFGGLLLLFLTNCLQVQALL